MTHLASVCIDSNFMFRNVIIENYCVMIFGFRVVESQWKVFWMIKDLLTGEISLTNNYLQQRKFTVTLSKFRVVQQITQETKHRDNISCSTSHNSNQAQEFKFPDVLVNSPSCNTHNSKQGFSFESYTYLFIVKLGLQNSQFRQSFWNILQYLSSYWSHRLGLIISKTFIFSQNCRKVDKSS